MVSYLSRTHTQTNKKFIFKILGNKLGNKLVNAQIQRPRIKDTRIVEKQITKHTHTHEAITW